MKCNKLTSACPKRRYITAPGLVSGHSQADLYSHGIANALYQTEQAGVAQPFAEQQAVRLDHCAEATGHLLAQW